jgi:hypothetical protein
MRRAILAAGFLALAAFAVIFWRVRSVHLGAVVESDVRAAAVIVEAARIADTPDRSAEMLAAAALRNWLTRERGAESSAVRTALLRRPPWGFPTPWPRPRDDYAAEFLASKNEAESRSRFAAGTDLELAVARRLLIDAVRARPGWAQYKFILGLVLAAQHDDQRAAAVIEAARRQWPAEPVYSRFQESWSLTR